MSTAETEQIHTYPNVSLSYNYTETNPQMLCLDTTSDTATNYPYTKPKTCQNTSIQSDFSTKNDINAIDSAISKDTDKYSQTLMEKDKLICNYMTREKELNKLINLLKLELSKKDVVISKLEDEIKNIENNFKNNINIISKNNSNEIESLKSKLNNLAEVLKSYEEVKMINSDINIEKEKKISEIQSKLLNNEKILKLQEIKEKNLIEENKQIPLLKSKINEYENIFNSYKEEIENLKKNMIVCDNFKENKNNINEKCKDQELLRLNYKIDLVSKELEIKNNEFFALNNQNNILQKDTEKFIDIFINELNNLLTYLEGLNVYSKNFINIPNSNFPTFENTHIAQNFNLRYDLMAKTINQIREKIIDIINKDIEKNQSMSINYINKDNIYNLMQKEKNDLLNDKESLNNNLKISADEIAKTKNELKTLNDEYNKLKNNFNILQNANKNLAINYKESNQNYANFLDNLNNRLKNFPINNNRNVSPEIKIINQIESLINLNKELNKQIKDIESINKKYKKDLNEAMINNKDLKQQMINSKREWNTQFNNLKNDNINLLNKQKETLFGKIQTLSKLLEDSNNIIKNYENEIQDLKNKNMRLEYNLQLLSNSHTDLENIVKNGNAPLRNQIDMNEQKYNELLKELELKELYIKSLEKLLNEENKQVPGKILSLKKNENNQDIINMSFSNDNNNNFFINDSEKDHEFNGDKYEEIKYNKYMRDLEIKNKVDNFNKNNEIKLNDLVYQSGGNINNDNIKGQNYLINENNFDENNDEENLPNFGIISTSSGNNEQNQRTPGKILTK